MLYHFSHDPTIKEFHPRPPQAHPDASPLVWTIDAHHSPLYLLPRDCPRVCYWPLQTTSQEDREAWFQPGMPQTVIAIESAWLERAQTEPLYRYTFEKERFVDCQDHGVWASSYIQTPINVERVENPLLQIGEANVELRVLPSLVTLGLAVMETTLHFSMIRMRNAQGWQGKPGTPVQPPNPSAP